MGEEEQFPSSGRLVRSSDFVSLSCRESGEAMLEDCSLSKSRFVSSIEKETEEELEEDDEGDVDEGFAWSCRRQ